VTAPTQTVALPQQRSAPKRLGEVLVEAEVITEAQLQHYLALQEPPGQPNRRKLGRIIAEEGGATEEEIATALATVLQLPRVNIDAYQPDRTLLDSFPRDAAIRLGAAPLMRNHTGVLVALVDPTDTAALQQLRKILAAPIRVAVVAPSDLGTFIDRAYAPRPHYQLTSSDAVRVVDYILTDAVRSGASDIHLEPAPDRLLVRMRIDGMLRAAAELPASMIAPVTGRLKVLFELRLEERRLPQDGRLTLGRGATAVDARISTMPSLYGEKIVIRLLGRAIDVPSVAHLGLQPEALHVQRRAVSASQGLVLVTGPTGSGKTTTLYSLLMAAADDTRNMVALEDPVEGRLPHVVQTQVDPRIGLTFAVGLRSILRQDPDVVLVGEIRDAETAELASQAAATGHLVLSSLHTTSAVAAISRLVNLDVDMATLGGALTAVVGQRLLRRVCRACAAPYTPAPDVIELLDLTGLPADAQPRRGKGCAACNNTGYLGRNAVFEVAPVVGRLRAALVRGADELELLTAAKALGMQTMRQAGLALAARGLTTYDEVMRATPADLDA
jgi:type IV pilus assembly protein PilB